MGSRTISICYIILYVIKQVSLHEIVADITHQLPVTISLHVAPPSLHLPKTQLQTESSLQNYSIISQPIHQNPIANVSPNPPKILSPLLPAPTQIDLSLFLTRINPSNPPNPCSQPNISSLLPTITFCTYNYSKTIELELNFLRR